MERYCQYLSQFARQIELFSGVQQQLAPCIQTAMMRDRIVCIAACEQNGCCRSLTARQVRVCGPALSRLNSCCETESYSYPRCPMARKYAKKAGRKVKRAMHERKAGTLRSGRSKKKVKSRKQAIAIGLSEARKAGAKVPRKKTARKK